MRRLCSDLKGTGGVWKLIPEDFEVEEIPAYLPSGSGEHTFVWIEKRGLSTQDVVRALGRALGAAEGEIGTAGMKDRQACARQWVSLPRVDPARAFELGESLQGVRILQAIPHGNKLRTGHLRGNRFGIVLRGVVPDAASRARLVLARLCAEGLPNFYGEQRFGRDAGNVEQGLRLVRGERLRANPRQLRLYVSAVQSELFNRVLERRMSDGSQRRALAGDVLAKCESGGIFVCEDPAVDQVRIENWEIVPTGPMFGPKMRAPKEGSAPASLEAEVLTAADLTIADFARPRRLAEGTRRALIVRPEDCTVSDMPDEGAIRLSFALPAGSYATVLLGEVTGPGPGPGAPGPALS